LGRKLLSRGRLQPHFAERFDPRRNAQSRCTAKFKHQFRRVARYAPAVSVPTTTFRKRGFFAFFVCAAGLGVGVWYVQHGGWWKDEQDVADDEGPELTPEGVGYRRGQKKIAPPRKKKTSEARQARGGAAPHAEVPMPTGPSGPSYEVAIAGNNLNLAPGTKDVPDLTDAELAGPMRDGTFLDACEVPSSTHVTVKVAIRNGRAVGVSAYAVPASREIAWCIERYVRGLQWPSNAKMDSFVTTY
jgi:hypothetical protein